MADKKKRVPENIPGRFYVDSSCIYCDLCRDLAPHSFAEFKEMGWAFVYKQPTLPEEEALCLDAMEACPTESIGNDGES
ncbi:MAG TPA: ferredoxin [Acidobacteriota bacterium]|nr:ferredoxin [Acidobacteriota bacterium]